MRCSQCGSDRVLTEGLEGGRIKVTCQECGDSKIKDQEGRQLLTDDMPAPDRREYLTEG